jgi:hypothetical protein
VKRQGPVILGDFGDGWPKHYEKTFNKRFHITSITMIISIWGKSISRECWLGLLKSWEYRMLGSLTHEEIIVEARGGLGDKGEPALHLRIVMGIFWRSIPPRPEEKF